MSTCADCAHRIDDECRSRPSEPCAMFRTPAQARIEKAAPMLIRELKGWCKRKCEGYDAVECRPGLCETSIAIRAAEEEKE